MADIATRRDPLDGVAPLTARSRLTIEAAPRGARLVLRGPDSAAVAAGQGFGLALPERLNTASTDGTRTAFKLGPDEWLLLAPENGEAEAYGAIEGAVDEPHSLVDVSPRNVGILVSGSLAADVLNFGVMLDLDLKAFPIGTATRTLFVKAEIVLWRKGLNDFHIEVWRSFAEYLHGQLEQAAREYVK
ncbi:sarcosine oxidase subunit gamma [Labrys miyagiensis]|uniref:Sarcosine oxidase subunit gamma n=1 Tax=Labrys miyagiensis TaxID=346912 RepID=A0ABQ6CBP3_9HYPH|nr:sarcosine oxidase subunit gamma family protein [Labrys miyagiensis]GLS17370.1 sarcosine oxidase subunit gamma [Labrys miyagiensis]